MPCWFFYGISLRILGFNFLYMGSKRNFFLYGLFFGVLLFLIPFLFYGGNLGFIGGPLLDQISDFLNIKIKNDVIELIVFGFLHSFVMSLIPFFLYLLFKFYKGVFSVRLKQDVTLFILFVLGVFVAHLIFVVFLLYLFSKSGIGF